MLQNFDLSVGSDYEFVGARNYVEALFRDPRFLDSVWNTAVIIAPSLVAELVLGLALALLCAKGESAVPTPASSREAAGRD